MKKVFFVHSHITYLAALAVIATERYPLDDVLLLSTSYKRATPVKVRNVVEIIPKGNLLVRLKRFFMPQYDSDYFANVVLKGEPFVLFFAWPDYFCKYLMASPNCQAFHFIEEGLSAYWNNMTLNEILFQRNPHQSVRSTLSLAGIKERLIDANVVFRGLNTAIQYVPSLYHQYTSDNRVHFYGFCEDSFCLAIRNKHVMDMAESLKGYTFDDIPRMDNRYVYVSDYNTDSHMTYEEYLQELDDLVQFLWSKNVKDVSIKWHYKCNEQLKDKLTSYFKSHFPGNVDIIPTEVIMEIVFIISRGMVVLGNNSSLLFYSSLSGHETLSLAKERNGDFEVYWRKVKLINA